MRKILLGLLATAALAAPVALASSADAATTGDGTYHYDVSLGTWSSTHDGTTHYQCNTDGSVGFTFVGADQTADGDGTGSGLIKGSVLVFSGTRAVDSYTYSVAGDITADGHWTLTGQSDSAGDQGVHASGVFLGIPNCVADPVVPVGNHGEYVSGAAHAGVKGKDLAAIAKDVTLVGPYKG